jgi:hypothetical protein
MQLFKWLIEVSSHWCVYYPGRRASN